MMSEISGFLPVPNLFDMGNLYIESSLPQEKCDFNKFQLETSTVNGLDPLLERANTQCQLDRDVAEITEMTTRFYPEGVKELPKHIPFRGLQYVMAPGHHVPGVPFQTVSPSDIMLRPTTMPAFNPFDTQHARHSASSSGGSTTPLFVPSVKPKKLASPRKVVNVSPRRTSSLKEKSKPKPPPVPSPRSKVSTVNFKADTKDSTKPSPMKPTHSSPRKAQLWKEAQHEDVDMEEDEEYILTPKASPRKNGSPSRIVTVAEKVQIAESSEASAEGGEIIGSLRPDEHEICYDVADIAPWGQPKTENDRIIEKILAIAKKNWHLIKRQDWKPRTAKKINLTGKVPCLIPGCLHKSLNNACLRKHLCAHFPNASFCPVCLHAFSRECSFARHAPGACKARLVKEFGFDGPGSANYCQWFNLYFLGLRDDVEMPNRAFYLIAGRYKHEPLYK